MSDRRAWLLRLLQPEPLRPPGAASEADFLARCIRCGRCVEICPYHSLVAADWRHGLASGTPVVVAREVPCYLCMLCPPICPTGALDATLREPEAVRMGVARVDPTTCYAHLGILCRTCVDECPLSGRAIVQDAELRPVVTADCVGCGVCERVCPPDVPAIRIEARTGRGAR